MLRFSKQKEQHVQQPHCHLQGHCSNTRICPLSVRTKWLEGGNGKLVLLRLFLPCGFRGPWGPLPGPLPLLGRQEKGTRGGRVPGTEGQAYKWGIIPIHISLAEMQLLGHTTLQGRLGSIMLL